MPGTGSAIISITVTPVTRTQYDNVRNAFLNFITTNSGSLTVTFTSRYNEADTI